MCSVVKEELIFGALRSRDQAKNLAELRTFFSGFRSYPFDNSAAEHCARIRVDLKHQQIGAYDFMIAAIALANDLVLVTHNTGELSRVPGLKWEDWETP